MSRYFDSRLLAHGCFVRTINRIIHTLIEVKANPGTHHGKQRTVLHRLTRDCTVYNKALCHYTKYFAAITLSMPMPFITQG